MLAWTYHRKKRIYEERLYTIVQQNSDMPAQVLLDGIYRQVYQHSGAVSQYDDITIVVVNAASEPVEE